LTLVSETVKTQSAAKWKQDLQTGKMPDFNKKPTVFLFIAE
jgi:16S rRNA (cytidine1402-2'-O)-methyltransferase